MLKPEDKVLLDVCCGRWGWSKEFAKRGWRCIGIDLLEHEVPPEGCKLVRMNLLALTVEMIKKWGVKFAVASTPCEEFAAWAMKHFQPNAPKPDLGIKLFKHVETVCIVADIPFVMENVRGAQEFLGESVNNAGSFHLWGNAVPLLMPQGITKGATQMRRDGCFARRGGVDELMYMKKTGSNGRAAKLATIPPELAACVADYAERILEQRHEKTIAVHAEPVRAADVDDGDECDRSEARQRKLAAED